MERPRDNVNHLFPVQELFIRQQQELCIAQDAQNVKPGPIFLLGVARWMRFYPQRIVQ